MTAQAPPPRWSAAEVEAGRDVASSLMLQHRLQQQDLGLLLEQVEREGRTTEVLMHALGDLLAIKSMICKGSRPTLDCLLQADVAAWAGVPPS